MNYLERIALNNPDFLKWINNKFYSNCIPCVPVKIWDYIKRNFEYQEDEFDEVLISPVWLLKIKKGDCDDFSLFAKTILTALGIPSIYILFGKEKKAYTHIAVLALGKVIDGTNENFNIIPNRYNFIGEVNKSWIGLNITEKRILHGTHV
jgi:hypothetical protein